MHCCLMYYIFYCSTIFTSNWEFCCLHIDYIFPFQVGTIKNISVIFRIFGSYKDIMVGKYVREQEFWIKVHQMHLYATGGEAAFKGAGLIISWFGTFFLSAINCTTVTQDVILFFAMSIVLEYAVQFVSNENKGTPKQILPGFLTILNFVAYLFALVQLEKEITNETAESFIYFMQLGISFITILVIFVDVLATICVGKSSCKPMKSMPERSLKNL